MNKRNKHERVELVVYLAKLLKNYPVQPGQYLNLYISEFPAINQLKSIFKSFVNQDDSYPRLLNGASGIIPFPEINRKIEYKLPIRKNTEPLLVFRIKN